MVDLKIYDLVMSQEIPLRLLESLAAAPHVEPHRIDMWVRCGGRITNLTKRSRPREKQPRVNFPPKKLTKRELETLQLLADGKTSKEASYIMGISTENFSRLLLQAKFRLDVNTTEQAILRAYIRGLIGTPQIMRADLLNADELQFLSMHYEGASAAEIGKVVGESMERVKTRLRTARRKLGVETTEDAARAVFGLWQTQEF